MSDIAVFRSARIPTDRNREVANRFDLHPAWTIEILSPNSSHTRVVLSLLHCLDFSTEMG
ncbi:hypothetical protein [Oxynema sp. CENA135]|uniref:hypothetical protein n=1 Tax=Oxynema sp. CENA135 TaxID=984206 RepID=UPI00351C0B8A